MSQLYELSRPFPDHLIKAPPKGKFGSYVPHSTITERLLSIIGPYDMRLIESFMGDDGRLEGIVLEMTFTIDGKTVVIQEAGDCEQPGNWKTQGARLKDAVSDGIKRCSMRIGLGTHLWSQDKDGSYYFLDKQLEKAETPEPGPTIKRKKAPAKKEATDDKA